MRLIAISAALFSMMTFTISTATAQTLDPFQIVGHTTTTHLGDEGVRTFTLACQADFGAAARMCTSDEVLNTIVWPTLSRNEPLWAYLSYRPRSPAEK